MYLRSLILFITIQLSLSAVDEIQIITSNVDAKVGEHVIATAFYLFETESDFNVMAKKLVDDMDAKYGMGWIGQIGSNNSALHTNQEFNTFIILTYKDIKLTLYKTSAANNENNYNLGSHVLDRIYKARNSTYKLYDYWGITRDIAIKNITDIVNRFNQFTNGFESHSCLRATEEDIANDVLSSCYSKISSHILSWDRHYEITIGETATYTTLFDSNYQSIAGFEFYLGPLYFEVYHLRC